jgi:hypothetical protein
MELAGAEGFRWRYWRQYLDGKTLLSAFELVDKQIHKPRWQSSSRKSATLAGSTKTFEAVQQERRRLRATEPRAHTANRDTV